jgi:hypothetical protein
MARSGETLLLKILAIHPKVQVVHNLDAIDDFNKEKSFQFLKNYEKKSISKNHQLFLHYNLDKRRILLLKQGVWKHKAPFNGLVLSRNPVSIYSSLKRYDKNLFEYDPINNFWFGNEERLNRWSLDIDVTLIQNMKDQDPVVQFCKFYNNRMAQLLELNLEIIRYEDLILDTENTIQKVCDMLNIRMNNKLLKSHEYYDPNIVGHGKNVLSKPIDDKSLYKYKENVTIDEISTIKKMCKSVYERYNYSIENNQVNFNK